MLELVGTENGHVEDRLVLIDDDNKPTKALIALAAAELAFDLIVATLIAKHITKRRK